MLSMPIDKLRKIIQLSKRLDYHMPIRWAKQLQQLDLDHVSNKKLSNPKHQKTRAYDIQDENRTRLQCRST